MISRNEISVSPRLILDLQGKTWLCGLCASRPAPHIVKHAREPHKRALPELGRHTHTHTHRAREAHTKERQHSHHTHRALAALAPTTVLMGLAPSAPPPSVIIGSVVFPFVCGVNVGGLLCGTSIESIESIKSIESIESVESSDSIESIESIQSIEPIESIEL